MHTSEYILHVTAQENILLIIVPCEGHSRFGPSEVFMEGNLCTIISE